MASPQGPPDTGSSGLIVLASPMVGAPLSAEQSEERTVFSADGMKTTELRVTKIFRDSTGRIRVEFAPREEARSASFVTLIDPPARSVVTLLPAEKRAVRLTAPPSAGAFGFAFPTIEGELRAGSPHTRTDELGIRIIDGIEFRGTHTELIGQKRGSVVTSTERWHSESMGLTRLIVVVNANGSHSVVLKHIRCGEPDLELFVVPVTYVVEEFRWPAWLH